MLNPSRRWRVFEAADELGTYGAMPFAEALARFERLWDHARAVRPDLGADWQEDLAPDLALARALNDLPPR